MTDKEKTAIKERYSYMVADTRKMYGVWQDTDNGSRAARGGGFGIPFMVIISAS